MGDWVYADLIDALAAIQRVRDVPFAPSTSDQTITTSAWVDGYNAALRAVHEALDGEQ